MKHRINQRIARIFFFIILLIGTILRVYNVGDKEYSTDEAFSVRHASFTLKEVFSNVENEPHPPLYYIMLHFWMEIFGDSEIATRSLSVSFGIISILLMYFLGRLLFNREVGMIASLILAISPFHIGYSQESRMYSLMAMLTLTSMLFFIRMMREKEGRFLWYYLVSSILLIYSHIYGLFVILAQNIYVMVSQKKYISLKKWAVLQIILMVAFILWTWVLVRQIIGINQGSYVNINWLPPANLSDLFSTFFSYAHYSLMMLAVFLLLSLSVLMTGKQESGAFLLLWLLTPILVPFMISALVFPIYHPKYTISASLASYMLVSRGINRIKNKYLKGLLLATVIFLSFTGIIYNAQH